MPKAKPAAPRLPVGAAVTTPAGAAAVAVGTATTAVSAPTALSSTAVVFAPPSLVDPDAPKAPTDEATQQPQGQSWGRKVKPPSMVLDEDVNGFKARKGGNSRREGGGGGGKKKNKKVCSLACLEVIVFTILMVRPAWFGAAEQECARSSSVEPGRSV